MSTKAAAGKAGAKPVAVDLERFVGKPLPHALEAEQAVLGSILQDALMADKVSDLLEPSDFYAEGHQIIFKTMQEMVVDGIVPDRVLLAQRLQDKSLLDAVGGADYLFHLPDSAPDPANVRQYAQIVAQKAGLRQIVVASSEALQAAYQPAGRTASEVISDTTDRMFEVTDRQSSDETGPKIVGDFLHAAVEHVETMYNREDPTAPLGVTTGFKDLDRATLGLMPKDFVVVAARPAMGKTAFILNVADNALVTPTSDPVVVFSLEMGAMQLVLRMMGSGGKIDQTKLRLGQLGPDDWERFSAVVGRLSQKQLYIDETVGLTPMMMLSRAQRIRRGSPNKKLGAVVVDYLQLMSSNRGANTNIHEEQRISEISRSMKLMAKQLNCPVIALAQLNRGVEGREDKRPRMSDLRSSGAIEQDADLIMFLYRDEVYKPDTMDKGICEVIIGKNRNGPLDTVRLAFLAEYMAFENYAHF